MNSKSVDLKGVEAMEDDNIVILRSDAGEPRKADICKSKELKLSNNANTKEGGSKESDRGDAAANKKNVGKKCEGYKAKYSAKCTINQINESPIKRAETNVNKIKLRSDNSNLQEAKYNRIMASINEIIQENIDIVNTKAISSDPQSEVATENKLTGESYLDKKDSRFKQPEKQDKKEIAKKGDKELVNFSEKMTNTKASNCTPLVNDVKNKSLVIKIPKHTSGCKLQEKQKMSTELNKKNPESPLPKLSSFQQRHARQTENCATIKRQTRDNLINKSNSYWATKIQTVPKDLNKKPKTLTKIDSRAGTFENDDIYTKKPVLHNNKVKKKHTKKVKSVNNKDSRTKLLMPTVVDEHSKLYYEAWVNNTATVSAQEQQLLEDTILQRLPIDPVKNPEMTPKDCTDKRFTGTIKVKYGKKLKQYLDVAQTKLN